ncbi:Rne/Rng family ribonuclease [Ichthyobacterium seriolicida]|uniref:Ribonuclease G n=1 Tax=Ichthyobacterium seriolicida TaxID=242600 RepID=A0A1J1DZ63_9FLAO|nr:Rne/Rng family ribonuclease [Ichthyobacterium seriolicida]BAV95207.1 ribonuclease G [Ichthyobacterium seriolicida]
MGVDLILKGNSEKVNIALLEDGRLIELHVEDSKKEFSVGDIYIGRVKKLLPSLNAAFVNIGTKKDAFIHYQEVGREIDAYAEFYTNIKEGKENPYPILEKSSASVPEGNISDVLEQGQDILVQIVKEPISTKGARLTAELLIAGRYLILVPFSNKVSISQKIKSSSERKRLKKLLLSIKPKDFGIIVRTFAKDKKVSDLDTDLNSLVRKWDKLTQNIREKTAPSNVMKELDKASVILRDIFSDNFDKIISDDKELCREIDEHLKIIAPDKKNIVKYFNSSVPIFEKFGVERQIKTSFGKTVSLTKGVYLVIEHTEAMHIIDVNSGNRIKFEEDDREQGILDINLIAASEIARQLKLRDMGGIIIIDFIDMKSKENRDSLFSFFSEEMKKDRAKHKILPITKFGLMQITRQRVRSEMNINISDSSNAREIETPIVLIDHIYDNLRNVILYKKHKGIININVHPFIASYIKSGFFSLRMKWILDLKRIIKIIPMYSYDVTQYTISDKNGVEITI